MKTASKQNSNSVHAPTWQQLKPEVTEQLLQDMTRRIAEHFHPDKVILFGSHAWGRPHEYSDLDLLVVMESDREMVDRMVAVADVAEVRFLPLDVLVYTPSELQARLDLGDPFFGEIMRRGRTLYDRELS